MIVKATKRKEEEIDFDDKRFNAGVDDDEATSHSRHSHHSKNSEDSYSYEGSPSHNYHSKSKERHSSRDEYWNSEYERRRRLAFESAPWNDEQAPPPRSSTRSRKSAEHYRDPWRRSKSPPSKWNPSRKGLEGNTGSKRSHSMSSISGSESGSDVSGSESFSGSDDSFTGSESVYTDGSDFSARSPRSRKERGIQRDKARSSRTVKSRSKPSHSTHSQRDKSLPKSSSVRDRAQAHAASKSRSSRSSLDDEASNTGLSKKMRVAPPPPPPQTSKPRRDSWSDSESGSMSRSRSSIYSGSETGDSEGFTGESDLEDERRMKNTRIKDNVKSYASKSLSNQHTSRRSKMRSSSSPVAEMSGPSKKAKMSLTTNPSNKLEKQSTLKSRHSSPPLSPKLSLSPPPLTKKVAHSPTAQNDATQKKPIKMTFKKKVN
jgi:zinc finger CCCH domain-containing protein 18